MLVLPARLLAMLLLLATLNPSCLALELPSLGGLFGGGASSAQPSNTPGTPEWWKKHRKQAVFVPGEGYQVEGFEGFYDDKGRSLDTPIDEIMVQLTSEAQGGGGLIPGLDPSVTNKQVREAIGLGPDQTAAQRLLQEGVERFTAKRYNAAAKRFDSAATRWPGTDLEALARFNQAEALFFDEQYQEAADTYIGLLESHPSTPRLNDSVERLWAIAQYWEKAHFNASAHMPLDLNMTEKTRPRTDTIGHAIRLYDAIRLNDPTGPRADDAIMATASIYFRQEKHHDADHHYGLLRSEYPRSDHQFEAHLLGLQSKLRKYQGPDYDGTPLEEAKQLEERIRTNFGEQLADTEKERLRTVRAQLAASVEERDLRMAAYYEGTEHYASARIYLAKVVEEHPDSPTAEKARTQLAAIDGRPAEPPTKMAWFVDLFPENQELSAIDNIAELPPTNLLPGNNGTQIAKQKPEEQTTTR